MSKIKLPGSQFSLNVEYHWETLLFSFSPSRTCQFRNLAGTTVTISVRRHDVIHVHTRRKRIYLQDVLGTSDSSLCDHCGVPGSRKSITIRWRHGRSLSRRRSCSVRIAFRSHETKLTRASCREIKIRIHRNPLYDFRQ